MKRKSKLSLKELREATMILRKHALKPSPKGNYYKLPSEHILKDKRVVNKLLQLGILVKYDNPDFVAYRKLNEKKK